MITPTEFTVPLELLRTATASVNLDEFKNSINEPTGNFFYDSWKIKEEFKGTVWETILNTLPTNVGEARVIVLNPATCYQSHADIDDRYHLNIQSESAYIIDLENSRTYKVEQDGIWYNMNAGYLHSAANMGRIHRIQLVVRQLLNYNTLVEPVLVRVLSTLPLGDSRYLFDQKASSWLNYANKQGRISKFSYDGEVVQFLIEKDEVTNFKAILGLDFIVEIND
jgi:hypothetical protein